MSLAVTIVLVAAPARAEFQVNTHTTYSQQGPAVAAGADGTFVVVWRSDRQASPTIGGGGDYRHDVVGRRFDRAGASLGAEFPVSTLTTKDHGPPVIVAAGDHFIVAWRWGGIDTPRGVFGRRLDARGSPVGDEFQVSASTLNVGYQRPAAAADAAGHFVVVWQEYTATSPMIMGRRYDTAGSPAGAPFAVGTGTWFLEHPAVAMDADGHFLVTWESGGVLRARHYDAAGNPAPGFPLSEAAGRNMAPAAAALGAGRFVVTWFNTGGALLARQVDAGGAAGPEFPVSARNGQRPTVAADAAGAFVVLWTAVDEASSDVFGQRFDAAGARDGAEFRVNAYTTANQDGPSLARRPDGDFLAAWTSGPGVEPVSQDGDDRGVFAQPFRDDLFRDGFEAGDLRAWSSAATGGGDLRARPRLDGEGHSFALAAWVNDAEPLYVQDDTPQDEGRYRAAFTLDPNGFDPGEASGRHRVRTFLVFESNPTRRLVALVLRRHGGQYSLQARVRLQDRSLVDTPFVPLSDAPHQIEIDWVRATRPDANDGSFALWIDDGLAARLGDLDNTSTGVEFVRLGAMGAKAGAQGTLLWDGFVSRGWTAIGGGAN